MNANSSSLQGERVALKPELSSIRLAGNWLKKFCNHHGVPAKPAARLDICLHEVLANVLTHGGAAALSDDIVVELRIDGDSHQGQVRLLVQDRGVAFDPLSSSPKSGAQSLETLEPGGLGIVMIRSNSDLLEYKREHGLNHLSIGVRWQRSDR